MFIGTPAIEANIRNSFYWLVSYNIFNFVIKDAYMEHFTKKNCKVVTAIHLLWNRLIQKLILNKHMTFTIKTEMFFAGIIVRSFSCSASYIWYVKVTIRLDLRLANGFVFKTKYLITSCIISSDCWFWKMNKRKQSCFVNNVIANVMKIEYLVTWSNSETFEILSFRLIVPYMISQFRI